MTRQIRPGHRPYIYIGTDIVNRKLFRVSGYTQTVLLFGLIMSISSPYVGKKLPCLKPEYVTRKVSREAEESLYVSHEKQKFASSFFLKKYKTKKKQKRGDCLCVSPSFQVCVFRECKERRIEKKTIYISLTQLGFPRLEAHFLLKFSLFFISSVLLATLPWPIAQRRRSRKLDRNFLFF